MTKAEKLKHKIKNLVPLDVESLECMLIESHYSKKFAHQMAVRICSKFGGNAMKAILNFCQLEELNETELIKYWQELSGWRSPYNPNKNLSCFEVTKLMHTFINYVCCKYGAERSTELTKDC